MKTIYECSHGKSIKWVTFYFLLVVSACIVWEVWSVSTTGNWLTAVLVIALLLAVLLLCFMVYPQYIIADEEGLGIHTLIRTIRIPYADIDRIERAPEDFMSGMGAIRFFGIGGVLGYIGLFRTKGYGTYIAYVTDRTKAFIIHRKNGRPIAISVAEPDEFMPYFLKGGDK